MGEMKRQQSMMHGLPDHVVVENILSKASWWDCRSIRAVSKGWRGAVEINSSKSMFAAIHRIPDDEKLTLAVSIYDPEENTWERMPPIPELACGVPISARCICVDGKLFVLGGRIVPSLDFLDDVYCMDLRVCKRVWKKCSQMQEARASFACITWKGNRIVIAGGQGESDLALSTVEEYDIEGDFWRELPELSVARGECTGAVVGADFLCVIGGYTTLIDEHEQQQTLWVNSIEIGNGSNEWEMIESSSNSSYDILGSCDIKSSSLQRLHPSTLRKILQRFEERESIVEGKIIADGEEDDEVMSISVLGSGEYATECELNVRNGVVSTKLLRVKSRRRTWEEIEIPFDLIPTVSCCSISL